MASIIFLTLFLNNCSSEKRFGFREKIRVDNNSNSAKVVQKNYAKPTDVLTTSIEKSIAPKLKEETAISKKTETKITSLNQHSIFENVTASVGHSNPVVLKKLLDVEQKSTSALPPNRYRGQRPVLSIIARVFLFTGLALIGITLISFIAFLMMPSWETVIFALLVGGYILIPGVILCAIGGILSLISLLINN